MTNVAQEIEQAFLDFKDKIEDDIGKLRDGFQENLKNDIGTLKSEYDNIKNELVLMKKSRPFKTSSTTGYLDKTIDELPSIKATNSWAIDNIENGHSLMPHNLSSKIINILNQDSVMRSIASKEIINTGNYYEVVSTTGNLETNWTKESEVASPTKINDMIVHRILLHYIYTQPAISRIMLDNCSIDLETVLAQTISYSIMSKEEESFFNGDGETMPLGILKSEFKSIKDYTEDERQAIKSYEVNFDEMFKSPIAFDKLIEFTSLLPSRYLKNAVWVMHPSVLEQIRHIKDDQGRFIWERSLQSKAPSHLLGYEVICSDNMPKWSDSDNRKILFGDFKSGYMIVDHNKMNFCKDEYTAKPLVLFYSSKLVGGKLIDNKAIIALTDKKDA